MITGTPNAPSRSRAPRDQDNMAAQRLPLSAEMIARIECDGVLADMQHDNRPAARRRRERDHLPDGENGGGGGRVRLGLPLRRLGP